MPKPYVPHDRWSKKAEAEGYRARSVYKLMDLSRRFKLLRPGQTVIDLGAFPGSWLQYASKNVGPKGRVIGFDQQKIAPVAPNVITHVADITDPGAVEAFLRGDGVTEADVVLCDAAPATSGIKDVDQWKSVELADAAMGIAKGILKPGGVCVVKIFRGADFDEFIDEVKTQWKGVSVTAAEASRERSKEIYVVAKKR